MIIHFHIQYFCCDLRNDLNLEFCQFALRNHSAGYTKIIWASSEERTGWLSHEIISGELEPGDHIYCYRTMFAVYSHHGIYIGDYEVIHFAGASGGQVKIQCNCS